MLGMGAGSDAATPDATALWSCSACAQPLPASAFSKAQRKRGAGAARCPECIAAGKLPSPDAGRGAQGPGGGVAGGVAADGPRAGAEPAGEAAAVDGALDGGSTAAAGPQAGGEPAGEAAAVVPAAGAADAVYDDAPASPPCAAAEGGAVSPGLLMPLGRRRGGTPGRRIRFSEVDEVREYTKSEEELQFEREQNAARLREMQERMVQRQPQRPDPRRDAAEMAGHEGRFRTYRRVRIDRGESMAPIGMDLSVKQARPARAVRPRPRRASPPARQAAEGSAVLVKRVARGSIAAGRVGQGDCIVEVGGSPVSAIEPGRLLGVLASARILEMLLYNAPAEAKARAAAEAAEAAAAARAAARAQQLKARQTDLAARWARHFVLAAESGGSAGPVAATEEPGGLFRTVLVDRRPTDGSLTLRPLGAALFVQAEAGGEGGTFALVRTVSPEGLVAQGAALRPMDQLIEVQGQVLSEVGPDATLQLLHSARLALVVANVDAFREYRVASNPPNMDVLDEIGKGIKDLSSSMDRAVGAVSARLGGMWRSWGARGKSQQRQDAGIEPDDMPESPDLFGVYAPMPVVRGSSELLSGRQWCSLWGELPERVQFNEARLSYCTDSQGTSLAHLYATLGDEAPLLLLLTTEAGASLGAFLSDPLPGPTGTAAGRDGRYWGTGETFVFALAGGGVQPFHWAGVQQSAAGLPVDAPKLFITASDARFAIGGGAAAGHAIELDDELHHGSTHPSPTFASPSLLGDGARCDFKCVRLEIWSFASLDEQGSLDL